MSKGKLFVISGASGVGKSTVLKKVFSEREDLQFSVSATTRSPRPGEQEGVHYFFVSKETFEKMLAEDAFVEHSAHAANYYGTPKAQLEEKLKKYEGMTKDDFKGDEDAYIDYKTDRKVDAAELNRLKDEEQAARMEEAIQAAEQKEIELISEYQSSNPIYGYNVENGGNATGKLSEETKEKISNSLKGKHYKKRMGFTGRYCLLFWL